ncbi:protein eyes shut isoform X2 [Leptopilina heterotoma]|uniref:protein eyes shut isoform X2 n=1 Tax=Leptopilina heterotoma TaxID=63436 RepID=UPI001CA86493|nr:protein eyes shut isoform X2 [Leptopilina heterotoma]
MFRFSKCLLEGRNKIILILLSTFFIITVSSTIHCNSHPCVNGICLDENNSSYSCYCIDGYTGLNCEINFDDCWSNPCENGATCYDAVAAYNCSCPEGFVGSNCEQKYSECLNQPCLNNGTCVDYNGFMCQCPEGYSGEYCEIDVSVCNETICKNSGECVEGPGSTFSCRCPEGWTGEFCEEDINECLGSPCQNGGLCINIPASYTCACLFGFTGKDCDKVIILCDPNPCKNNAICLFEDFQPICYCVPDYHGVLCELKYDDCAAKFAKCENGGTCIDGINSFTCSCPIQYSGEMCNDYIGFNFSTIPPEIDDNFSKSRPTTMPSETTSVTISSENVITTPPTFIDSNEINFTDSPPLIPITKSVNVTIDIVSPTIPSTVMGQVTPKQNETSFGNFSTQTTTEIYGKSFNGNTIFIEETITSGFKTMPMTTTISSNFSISTTDQKNLLETTSPEEMTTIEDKMPILTTTMKSVSVTSSTESSILTSELSTSFKSSITTEESFPKSTFTTFESITITPPTDGYLFACNLQQCANTSLCLFNFTKCDCSYENNCKLTSSIKNAAFNGKSYIRQQVPFAKNDTFHIALTIRTKAKSGIIIHAFFDDERFILLYVEMGQLKFQFSCGLQTMLFGEIDSPINNGFNVNIEMRFHYIVEEKTDKCSATLLLNNTMAMSGEQILPSHEIVPQIARLHLGGIPIAFTYNLPEIALGFLGCMSSLKINNIDRNFATDSIEIFQVEECTSFLCLSNPCSNSGACEEMDGTIRCKCPLGFSGDFCEKSACDNNPCHLGATCITYPGTTFLCICPLGMHGLYCEEDFAILQPSFSTFMSSLSSYMAYGVPASIRDGMELKFSVLPHTVEQISLIAYLGQSGTRAEITDHFSVTFVRGYIMLTWDLGSGIRRIFTDKPLNMKTQKVHILRVGRKGREAWLSIEGIGNISGETPGSLTRLDVAPILYIGGHKSKNFENLPHDLPLHTGFSGCIYDIELRTEDNVFPITKSSPATGRGVGECHRVECSHNSCKNGAVCLNHGPTYSCICMKDWEGTDCSIPSVNCTSSKCQKLDN